MIRDGTAFSSIDQVIFSKSDTRGYAYISLDVHAILPLIFLAPTVRAMAASVPWNSCHDTVSLFAILNFGTCDDDDEDCTFVRGTTRELCS